MRALIVVLTVCGALFLIGPAGATGTLDQSQTVFGYSTDIGEWSLGVTSHAQTFTAGMTGSLDQVDLVLTRSPAPGDVTVEIRTLSDGRPSSSVLGHGLLLGSSVPVASGDSHWIPVPLSFPANVVAGSRYAIVLTAYHGRFQILDIVDVDTRHDYYAGGQELWQSWYPYPGVWVSPYEHTYPGDMAFKTYVTPFH
jgi:hypothetical protein